MLIGGVIGARVMCEMMIVIFQINDNLKKVVNKQAAEVEAEA